MTAAVVTDQMTVRFGSFTAVDRLSIRVERGEIFGFLGANGAGKTTTIRVLTGLQMPTSGHVEVAGLTFDRGADAIKRRVGYMSQNLTLYPDLTVEENLSFTAALRKIPPDVYRRRAREGLEFIGFPADQRGLVRHLPGGLKQEVSLVAALLHDPDILFLDEPTAGVSPSARARFWSLIKSWAGLGKTVFVTTHYMDEAEECRRIAFLGAGRTLALGSPGELKTRICPEPLFELCFFDVPPDRWQESLQGIATVDPHGMVWHVTVQSSADWTRIMEDWGPRARARPLSPSLEDVFLRLAVP